MKTKKVLRYYSECGKGFWKKQKALDHESNCKCWKNPQIKGCLSCKNKCFSKDNNGANEPQFFQEWEVNNCDFSVFGVPVHEAFTHIKKYCPKWEEKGESNGNR